MEYRKDNRSTEQFASDIQECSSIERRLMTMYVAYLNRHKKIKGEYTFSDNGVDNDGNLIEDDSKVHCAADFVLHNPERPDRKIDIKFSRNNNSTFHFKTNQMTQYIKEDVCIVNFMGVDTEKPKFSIFTPKDLEQALETGKKVYFKAWGGKECIKFKSSEQNWRFA